MLREIGIDSRKIAKRIARELHRKLQIVPLFRPTVSPALRERARKARNRALVLAPMAAAVVLVNRYRMDLFHVDEPVRFACVVALIALGAAFARDAGRAFEGWMLSRVDRGTAGTIGFVLRLALLIIAFVLALRIAGLTPRTLAVGGAVTAVVLGLAAQTTIGNLFAGVLLLSVRPFRVGDKVRLQAGNLAGFVEGTVAQLGLLYVTLQNGEDTVLVPNNTVVSSAIVPLRNPANVDVRVRLLPGMKPSQLQKLIEEGVTVPTRHPPHIQLEEINDEEVVMRITATPELDSHGPQLADEILAAVERATREHVTLS
jgi:small-conductance mechanosensitive channel